MTTVTCTSCGEPVLLAPNNRVLTTQPTTLGIYDPTTGDPYSTAQIQARIRATRLAGHSNHRCPAPRQAALFDQQEAH